MTRNSLIDEIALKTERTKDQAGQMLDAVLATITGALGRGEKVDLRGFDS
jgi:DNA-binding protein HU-beta